MTSINDTYRASVKTAATIRTNSITSALMALQASIASVRQDIGYREGFPTGNATYASTLASATKTYQQAVQDAHNAYQTSVETAKNVARDAGERLTA